MRNKIQLKEIIKNQFVNYFSVGLWNTFFGIAFYTILLIIFGETHYIILCFLSNIISITNAYICYKIFVFKTKGNILKEYLRCYAVYGVSMILGPALMYIFVDKFKITAIISNLIVSTALCLISYFGHKTFSFKKG